MNWDFIKSNSQLIYASLPEDIGFRTWSLKKIICNVKFYEEYPVEEIDRIVCSTLKAHQNSLDVNRLATILGFNVVNDFNVSPKRYEDKAEYELFNAIIKPVLDWGLAKRVGGVFNLTELGSKAFNEGKKYKFFSGTKVLFENPNMQSSVEGDNLFFPFYDALGIFSEIENRHQIEYEKINILEIFENEQTDLIEKHNLQSKEPFFIFKSEPTPYFSFDRCDIDIRLFCKDNEYSPIIFFNDRISVYATNLLNEAQNNEQKNKKIEWGLYLRLIKDPDATLDYNTIIPFEDLLELNTLIQDSRLVWSDNRLFSLIAEISNANQWSLITSCCPIEILKQSIEKYKDRLDWTSFSQRIDDDFLIKNATRYPWNFNKVISKEGVEAGFIKTLLLIPELREQEWDWDKIMPLLDFDFIKSNIDKVDFDLFEITKSNREDLTGLIIQYPSKSWDWIFISEEFDLLYLLENIHLFKEYILFKKVISRAFTSEKHVGPFCQSATFRSAIIEFKDSKLVSYSPNQEKYFWDEQLIDLLENNGFLVWESGNYFLGFECNPYLNWTFKFFSKYYSKITTQKGYDSVSARISDTLIVTTFSDFNWNWDLISNNSQIINNSQFLFSVKEKLNLDILLRNISNKTLNDIFISLNVKLYLDNNSFLWPVVTEKISIDIVRKNIEYQWDWQVLTRRVFDSIKIESISNPRWIDKWDWKFLTMNLDFSIIIEKLDELVDYWDWEYLSRRLDKDFLLRNLPDYNEYWDWQVLLNERFDKTDFIANNHISEIATCISFLEDITKSELWSTITKKFDCSELEGIIAATYKHEIFLWDYNYFYNLPEFNPRQYLNTCLNCIQWKEFSFSQQLNYSLKFDKSLFSYEVWLRDIIKLLKNFSYKWDYISLSRLDSINWNDTILSIEVEKWDWHYLSEYSGCFKKEKDFLKRFKKFSNYIDYHCFSKRTDSNINENLLTEFINNDWDWGVLSANTACRLSLPFIKTYKDKDWDWQALSIRQDIDFDNSSFIELSSQNWDWVAISFRQDLIFSEEFIVELSDKPLVWDAVTQNSTFIPNRKTLSLLKGKSLNWKSISKNSNLSIEVLWDYKEFLSWKDVTRNQIIDLSDFSFLTKYQEYLDWDFISNSTNFIVSVENLQHFKGKLNWKIINSRDDFNISPAHLEPFADVLNWSRVSQSMDINFNEALIEKYRNLWDWQVLRNNPQVIEKLDNTLKKYVDEFNCVDFLEQFDTTPYIYHYTHLFNAIDIIKERKILSRSKAEGLFSNAAGNLVTRRGTAHDYARFYFRPQTPTQFYNECLGHDSSSGYLKTWQYWDGEWIHCSKWKSYYSQARNLGLPKCPIPVFFKFDLKEVLMKIWERCYYSTGNMQTNWAQVKKVSKEPKSLNVIHLYSDVSDYENYKQYSQQEFLVQEELNFSEFQSFEIICYNEEYMNLLKSQLSDDPICEKIHSDGWGVFHRRNRELRFHETDTEISITSEYHDSAYFSIKGAGLKSIQILNSENIQKETSTELLAYPEITFTKTTQPLEVYFVDLELGKRDWLVYTNHSFQSEKNISNNGYKIPKEVLEQFLMIDTKLSLKLSKELFYHHMVDSNHGIAHTTRVLFGTSLLLFYMPEVDESMKIAIYYSAIIHDLGKTSDMEGATHGEKSANLYQSKMNHFIKDDNIRNLALNAIKYHSIDDSDCPKEVQNNIIWKVLKDADALDRGRFWKKCDKSYLRLELFKSDIGNQIIGFMDKLSQHSEEISWNNPYDQLATCIKQINS